MGTPRPIDRAAVYRSMGSVSDPPGRRRRVALDALAARRVLPVISTAFFDDDPEGSSYETPTGLLTAADRVLARQYVDPDTWERAFDGCKFLFAVRLGGVDPGNKERAACAWLACAATLRTAFGEDPFLDLPIDELTQEGDIGLDYADAARFAAEAVSAEVGRWNVERCREFWFW
jgi:hypothetical protein